MQHRDKIVLQKVIAEIDIGVSMLGNYSLDEFLENEMLKRALGMTTINIGELIKNVTPELRNANTSVPWRAIAGMRDITAHKYQTLRLEDVYNTVQVEFPSLKKALEEILVKEKTELDN